MLPSMAHEESGSMLPRCGGTSRKETGPTSWVNRPNIGPEGGVLIAFLASATQKISVQFAASAQHAGRRKQPL